MENFPLWMSSIQKFSDNRSGSKIEWQIYTPIFAANFIQILEKLCLAKLALTHSTTNSEFFNFFQLPIIHC